MKTIQIEKATLDSCIAEAQQDRVVITRNGAPVAMIVGVGGLDEEHVQLSGSEIREIRCHEIRCQFVFLGKNDELTPDFGRSNGSHP